MSPAVVIIIASLAEFLLGLIAGLCISTAIKDDG